jgi:hypothetical protein
LTFCYFLFFVEIVILFRRKGRNGSPGVWCDDSRSLIIKVVIVVSRKSA